MQSNNASRVLHMKERTPRPIIIAVEISFELTACIAIENCAPFETSLTALVSNPFHKRTHKTL